MSRRNPLDYVRHMLDHAEEALNMVRGRSREDLDGDRMLNLALVRLVKVVGEASRHLPEEFRSSPRKHSGGISPTLGVD